MSGYTNGESGATTFAILRGFNDKPIVYKLINSSIDNGVIWFTTMDEDNNLVEIKTSMVNVILFKQCDKKENQNEQGI